MKTAFSTVALAGTVLLHAALVAAVLAGLSHGRYKPVEPWPMEVQLLPPPAQNAPPVASAAPPAPRKPARKPPPSKRIAKPKPAPKPRPTPAPQAQVAEAPVESEPEPQDTSGVTAAPAPAEAPAPPAPSVNTGVSIPASYAASNREPEYPILSRRYEQQGTVVLEVLVKADGTAGEVKLKSSSGYPLLDKSAISAVRGWRFNPATRDGKPVAQWYPLPITFKLQN